MRKNDWNGMNWIRKDKRLALYARDGFSCAYCGESLEDGITLSLDHLIPRSQGTDNSASNLITACKRCNSARGDRPVAEFATAVAEYLDHGIEAQDILDYIERQRLAEFGQFKDEAREIIARRSTYSKALNEASVTLGG